jgi:hypothetical protein
MMVAQTYPEDTARMVRAYLEDPQGIERAVDPLGEAARRGGGQQFWEDVFGTKGRPVHREPAQPPMESRDLNMDEALIPPGASHTPVLDGVAGEENPMPTASQPEQNPEDPLRGKRADGDREEPG